MKGYFQYHTSVYAPHKSFFRALFEPVEAIKKEANEMLMSMLGSSTRTLVAVHLRRGDYDHGKFKAAPEQWYLGWLKKNWNKLEDPILFIASDEVDK